MAALFSLALPLSAGCGRVGLKLLGTPTTDEHPAGNGDADAGDAGNAGCVVGDCDCNLMLAPVASAHWLLDETTGSTAAEATGSAPMGVLTNFGDVPWMAGRLDGALSFDGVDDCVHVGAVGGAFRSLAFWAKPGSSVAITNTTNPLAPSTVGPDNDWDAPEKAFSEGMGSATANLNLAGSKAQHWGGFHIAAQLPPGVSVLGITVALKSASFGVINGIGVELSADAGASHTDAGYGGVALVGTSNVSTYGGPDQLWGRTWQPADFSDENFRVRVKLGGLLSLTASVDYVTVQIKFSDVANPRNIMNPPFGPKGTVSSSQMGCYGDRGRGKRRLFFLSAPRGPTLKEGESTSSSAS